MKLQNAALQETMPLARMGSFCSRRKFHWLLFGAAICLGGCKSEEKEAQAPPVSPEIRAERCSEVGDAPREGLPAWTNGYCIDPDSDVRRYGTAAPSPLDAVCVELFNGECELYKSYGLEGVKTLRYVPNDAGPQTVNVVVSSFRRSSGAFGFFTRRILGDDVPARATVERIESQGRAVMGIGMTYLWRGKDVVEMTYVSDEETPGEIEQNAPRILKPLVRDVSDVLVGSTEPERIVRLLEEPELDPLGVASLSDGLLQIAGTGSGAVGYFSTSEMPHRLFVAQRRDDQGASDLMRLLKRSGVSKKLKNRDILRLRRTAEERAPETWYLRRQGALVMGVGPALDGGSAELSTPEERKEAQRKWEAYAVKRLMAFSARERDFEK